MDSHEENCQGLFQGNQYIKDPQQPILKQHLIFLYCMLSNIESRDHPCTSCDVHMYGPIARNSLLEDI